MDTLSLWFDIDPSSVICPHICLQIFPKLWCYFGNQILSWPYLHEWRNHMRNWEEFPDVVDAVDTTPHEIDQPLTEP